MASPNPAASAPVGLHQVDAAALNERREHGPRDYLVALTLRVGEVEDQHLQRGSSEAARERLPRVRHLLRALLELSRSRAITRHAAEVGSGGGRHVGFPAFAALWSAATQPSHVHKWGLGLWPMGPSAAR
jgi:hypothetical protein